jgi:hypothetical protein
MTTATTPTRGKELRVGQCLLGAECINPSLPLIYTCAGCGFYIHKACCSCILIFDKGGYQGGDILCFNCDTEVEDTTPIPPKGADGSYGLCCATSCSMPTRKVSYYHCCKNCKGLLHVTCAASTDDDTLLCSTCHLQQQQKSKSLASTNTSAAAAAATTALQQQQQQQTKAPVIQQQEKKSSSKKRESKGAPPKTTSRKKQKSVDGEVRMA